MSVRGACPSVSAPMQTGDGLLVRLVLHEPISVLSTVCLAAEEHGNGIVEITQRGSLQVRGLSVASAPRFAQAVTSLQIGADEGPPLVTSPLLGFDASEPFDSNALVRSLLSAFDNAHTSLKTLSAKVSVLVDGGGSLHLDAVSADIRLVADGRRQSKVSEAAGVYQLSLAGNATDATQLGHVSLGQAPAVVLALLHAIADRGPTARAKNLLADIGLEAVLHTLRGQLLEQPTDTGGTAHRPDNPLGARPRPPANPLDTRPRPPANPLRSHCRPPADPLGTHLLKDGSCALGVALPFGHTTAATLRHFAQAAADCGATSMRPAPGRALLAIGLSQAAAERLRELAEHEGFIVDACDARRHVVACAGAPACASAQLSTRQLAPEVARATQGWAGTSKVVHLAGCSKGCAHPGIATLTVVGLDRIVVNGRASDPPNATGVAQSAQALLANIEHLCRDL